MHYPITVKQSTYHKAILLILNFNLKLTNTELDIVSIVLDNTDQVLDSKVREVIRLKLNKDKFTINNYIKRLIDKGIFIRTTDSIQINPSILEIVKDNKVSFELIIDDNTLQN